MDGKTVIYTKLSDGSIIPVTARIEWFPDGTIKPLMYWTPDGSCYEVKHVYEMTPLAFLKDGGQGIRFKVRAGIIDTPEPYSNHYHFHREIYLYFADDMFCGKNFIDERYGHESKEFIPVTLDVFPDRGYEVIYFKAQGTRYMVEKTIAVEPRASFHAGGIGIWHKVEARQVNDNDDECPNPLKSVFRMAALYFEVNKWFVSVKTSC